MLTRIGPWAPKIFTTFPMVMGQGNFQLGTPELRLFRYLTSRSRMAFITATEMWHLLMWTEQQHKQQQQPEQRQQLRAIVSFMGCGRGSFGNASGIKYAFALSASAITRHRSPAKALQRDLTYNPSPKLVVKRAIKLCRRSYCCCNREPKRCSKCEGAWGILWNWH